MMKRSIGCAIAAGLLICGSIGGYSQQGMREQRSFGAEGVTFQHPFPLPRNILDLLSTRDEVKDALDYENLTPNKLPGSWFLASQIHLAGPTEVDIIVMGRCPVCGANVVPFWIFRPTANGYQLIMAGGGLALDVMNHRTHGYLDVETALVAQQKPCRSLYRFDGKTYQLLPNSNRAPQHRK